MRIQHNIMAMNAYRNYTNNVSAMKSNLEKLSSGYKINRAGDDAAGLAISEKMRAQITGLETAQKNAKDGISLIQTAEGALTEVHDMLNRMVELATQSANGTYDNETDRAQMQKEIDQLRSEINRIADSSNFNGIKLLDGSMDGEAVTTAAGAQDGNFSIGGTGVGALPAVADNPYADLGVNTVLHKDVTESTTGSEFGVSFHDYTFANKTNDSMTIKIGEGGGEGKTGATIKLTRLNTDGSAKLDGDDIVTNILAGTTSDYKVEINGEEWKAGEKVIMGGQKFTMEAGSTTDTLKFKQDAAPTNASEEVSATMNVTISGVTAATKAKYTVNLELDDAWAEDDKITIAGQEFTIGNDGSAKNALDGQTAGDYTLAVSADGKTLTITANTAGVQDEGPTVSYVRADATATGTAKVADGVAGAKAKVNDTTAITNNDVVKYDGNTLFTADGTEHSAEITIGDKKYTVKVSTDLKLSIEAKQDGADTSEITLTHGAANTEKKLTLAGGADEKKASTEYDISDWTSGKLKIGDTEIEFDESAAKSLEGTTEVTVNGKDYTVSLSEDGETLTLEQKVGETGTGNNPADDVVTYSLAGDLKVKLDTAGKDDAATGFVGDYNVETTQPKTVKVDDKDRLASTTFNITKELAVEGAKVTIGKDTYEFTADTKKLADATGKYVDISSGDLAVIAQKLAEKATGNQVYSVGANGTNKITVTEQVAWDNQDKKNFDLTTAEGVEKSLKFEVPANKTTTDAPGKGLTLQIGDTAEDFNQLKVNIKDMHTSNLGQMTKTDADGNTVVEDATTLADISIADQDSASKAVDVIKRAINQVSDTRGTLGATQNRLDHTINNLSVMTENIQDAESTIRDVDIAEEMMAYTKNNILIQSAQAMLAQANQVPQGVLQLLG